MTKRESNSTSSFGYGLLTGALITGVCAAYKNYNINKHRNEILDHVKSLFLREGPIEAAWIEHMPAPYSDSQHSAKAYFGGVTRDEDGTLQQYQFAVDAKNGELLDIYKI
ncbi:hypothetical protein ACNAN0_05665 [Agrilactobacillus fermenti]|uniref:hypothetical protein n=1 Tax=Agrilactobacillus fermenti TaxID=2586909 RepID=UPI003A5BDD26